MDELLINMFSLIADQVRSKQELFDEEGKIMQALLNNGYHLQEADAALTLMQSLVQREAGAFLKPENVLRVTGVRTMNREERERFSPEAFSFVTKLALLGIITEDQREELIERALNVCLGRIDLNQVKAFIAISARGRDDSPLFSGRRINRSTWN